MRARPERRTAGRATTASMLDSRAVRWLVAALFMLHGLVHMVGFAAVWGLGQRGAVANAPMIPPGLAAGSPVVLALGVLWLIAMAAFLAAAVGLVLHAAWWKEVAAGAAALSLLLCVAWWNDAVIGALINVVILAGLAIQAWATRARQPKGSLT
jgi:hypothetical protein